jgi:PIN domain nuclease of toxin-antitoxin system
MHATGSRLPVWSATTRPKPREPLHHRDPFDRLLIAESQRADLAVLTADQRAAAYGIDTIDATA